jgi:Holliday junction resolvase RusA-like endonuclease
VRYEDLAQNPINVVESIYDKLQLGDFEVARPNVENYVETLRDYRPNKHVLEDDLMAQIRDRWSSYFEKYGY